VAREHGRISLSIEEIAEVASEQPRCIVATVDENGTPCGDAAACTFHLGRLYFAVPLGTRTLRNIEGDPRVCCTMEDHPVGAGYYTIKGAMLHGHAERHAIGSPPEVARAIAALPDPVSGKAGDDRVIFSVGTDDVASFDFAKINRRFEQ